MGKLVTREIANFLSTEVKNYGLYVVHTRALPSILDGMRVGARKILYASITNKKLNPAESVTKDNPEVKMPSLIGNTMDLEWNHGDAALKNTMEQLAKVHVFQFAPLEVEGQIGTLREPTVNTASRYLSVRRSKFLKLFEHSKELWQLKVEDGTKVEPKYFLPIVPMTLLYRTNAPGYGFGFRSFAYNIDDIIDSMLNSIQFDTCTGLYWSHIEPHIEGIKKENLIYNSNIQTYYNVGEYKLINKRTLEISDLPFNQSYDKYEKHLDKLKTEGYISDWKNLTRKNDTKFHIIFPIGRLEILVKQKLKFFNKLKLYTKIPKDHLNLIDIDGKTIINFSNIREFIDGFVSRRLDVYVEFRQYELIRLQKVIDILQQKINFIQLIIDGKIEIRRKNTAEILNQCLDYGFDFADVIDDLLKLPIKRLTQKEIDKASNNLNNILDLLDYYNNITPKEMYIKDLIDFKSKYCAEITKINK